MEKVFVMDSFEKRLLIEYLNGCRTIFLEENKPIEDVNDILMKVIKARSKHINDKIVYKMKMKDFDYRVLIGALNSYRLYQKSAGLDRSNMNKILLKIIDAYEK